MTNAVKIAAVLLLFFAAAAVPFRLGAQDAGASTVVQEAVRRQAWTVELRQKLAQAQGMAERKDLAAASKLYEACYDLVQQIGSGIDAERQVTVSGLVGVRLELARQAAAHGDYKEADTQVRDALRVAPQNPEAVAFKRENDHTLAQLAGRIPSDEVLSTIPTVRSNKVDSLTLVQDGKLLYEMGKLDESEVKLRQAITEDPDNKTAYYYLNLVQEARFGRASLNKARIAKKDLIEVEEAWNFPVKRELLPVPNPYARTNLVFTGQGRQTIISKLNRIRLNETPKAWENMQLGEVLRGLGDEARARDPDKVGINFLIMAGAPPPAAAQTIDPNTGLPVAAPATSEGPQDLSTVNIKISSVLRDLRLADVLDAITRTADQPIKYSIEDYAVVFSAKGAEATPLYVRKFKINPNTFIEGLEGVFPVPFSPMMGATEMGGMGGMGGGMGGGMMGGGMGGGMMGGGMGGGMMGGGMMGGMGGMGMMGGMGGMGGAAGGLGGGGMTMNPYAGSPGMQSVMEGSGMIRGVTITNSVAREQQIIRDYFTAEGLDFSPTSGKSIFFNDRQGILTVRATLSDLDVIEAAIETLNVTPPQVMIKTKFADISQDDSRALGFDWFLGNFLMGGGKLGAQGGTAPSFSGQPTPANPGGVFPGNNSPNLAQPTTISPAQTDSLLTGGLRNSAPAVGTLTGILTDPQFRLVVHALEQRSGTELLAAPEVTTFSGRQAQIRATDMQTVILMYDFSQAYGGGLGGYGGAGGGLGGGLGGGYGGGYTSDRNLKTNFASVDPQAVLAKVAALPVTTWNYKADRETRHLGPMAQDFYAAFGVGTDNRHIAPVDANGVALAAIKGLNQKLEEKDAKIEALEKDVAELKALVKSLAEKSNHTVASRGF